MSTLEIVGRQSSHFTRLTRIFAAELEVPYQLVPVYDMAALDPEAFGGNPALKIPVLRRGGSILVGAENICRTLAELARVRKRIVWPEQLSGDLVRNAQELVWHCMAAQVQLVLGTALHKLPADNPFFVKSRTGFDGALRWLDTNLDEVLTRLPPRDLSLFEASLHCLIEHLQFRPTLTAESFPALVSFAKNFALRPSAQATVYRFDVRPT